MVFQSLDNPNIRFDVMFDPEKMVGDIISRLAQVNRERKIGIPGLWIRIRTKKYKLKNLCFVDHLMSRL